MILVGCCDSLTAPLDGSMNLDASVDLHEYVYSERTANGV